MQDFNAFYDDRLKPLIVSLDEDKKNIKKKYFRYLLLPFLILLLIALCLTIRYSQPSFVFLLVFIFVFVGAIIHKKISSPYVEKFKTTIITELVKFVHEDLVYDHENYIDEGVFRESRLYNHRIDSYKGEDYISGKVDKTWIEFSEVIARYKTETRTKNGTRTQWHTLFDGLFFIADFNKEFNSDLIIKPDIAERMFGRFGQKLQKLNIFEHGELIKMENPDFEKVFRVHGTDQREARYILTPALMEQILNLNKKINRKGNQDISLSFINSKLYIAVPQGSNLFEPRIFGKEVVKTENLMEYYIYIKLMVGIVEDLDLNTRIWTKE